MEDIIDGDGLNARLDIAIRATQGSSAWSNDRERPYDGQPHTDDGERGKTLVEGLTMRDIMDCFVRGYLQASEEFPHERTESGKWNHNSVYECEDTRDPLAIGQCMMCNVEKMMGIFPNVPKLEVP